MICYRIAKARFATSIEMMVNGEGANENGGRWNPPGVPAVYASEHLSLGALEILVHTQRVKILPHYRYLQLEVDDNALTKLELEKIRPTDREAVGAELLADNVGFIVASAVLPLENNVVLNPLHKAWNTSVVCQSIENFPFDARLIDR